MNNDSNTATNTATTTATGTFARFIPYYSLKKLYIALMLYAAVAATIITVIESFYSNFVYASGLTLYTAMAVGWTISFGLCVAYGIPMFAFLIALYHFCEVLDPAPTATKH